MASSADRNATASGSPEAGLLQKIWIFPVKSLDGVLVDSARITPGGSLEHDREFALFDERGEKVNAKRHESIHRIRARFEPRAPLRGTLDAPGYSSLQIDLADEDDRKRASAWLGEFFGFAVEIRRAPDSGFPDDTKRPGPTLISRASLQTASDWLAPLSADQLAERFRANLEVENVPPFWEDRLLAIDGVPFRVGEVQLLGLNPCARCVVPTRDPQNSEIFPGFSKILTTRRKETLPAWADANLFSHYYRISTNTSIDTKEAGKTLRVGDAVSLAS